MTTPLADVNYYEPWWMQIAKAVVIFAVGVRPRDELARSAGLAVAPRGAGLGEGW